MKSVINAGNIQFFCITSVVKWEKIKENNQKITGLLPSLGKLLDFLKSITFINMETTKKETNAEK